MNNLSVLEQNMIGLYKRSRKDAEGWADVSNRVWPLVEQISGSALFEIQKLDAEPICARMRATDKCLVLMEYL